MSIQYLCLDIRKTIKAPYLSREKGGLALYALAQRAGPEIFDHWLGNWLTRAKQKRGFLTSMDFYNDLKAFIPAKCHPFVKDWFERRLQYRITINNAVAENGDLALTLTAEGGFSTGAGAEGILRERRQLA